MGDGGGGRGPADDNRAPRRLGLKKGWPDSGKLGSGKPGSVFAPHTPRPQSTPDATARPTNGALKAVQRKTACMWHACP